jgi:hypothetical protein
MTSFRSKYLPPPTLGLEARRLVDAVFRQAPMSPPISLGISVLVSKVHNNRTMETRWSHDKRSSAPELVYSINVIAKCMHVPQPRIDNAGGTAEAV